MSGEGPQLFTNKPKKSKKKANVETTVASPSSSGAAAPPIRPPRPSPPFPPPPSRWQRIRSFARNFLWPLLLFGNFSLAAYVLITRNDDQGSESGAHNVPTDHASNPNVTSDEIITSTPNPPPVMESIQRATVPEDQQRELFKWMLEERRQVKPKDDAEKRRLDEEKAILKHFIRATSIPGL